MTITEARNTLETDKVLTSAETKIASGYVCGLIGKEIADKCGISPLTVVRHTQNIYAKTGPRFSFGLQSSANIDTNPRTENACLQIGEGIYSFYKTYFDGIITFEKDDRERQGEKHYD